MIYAWKLFEESKTDIPLPRTLVHGLPKANGTRSRILELETWYKMEVGTPGFNLFPTRQLALRYLPRFRVRAPQLVLCKVEVDRLYKNLRGSYYYAGTLFISTQAWSKREKFTFSAPLAQFDRAAAL